MRAVELVIGRHAKSLKEAMGFWKQQAAEFKRGQGRVHAQSETARSGEVA